MLHAIRFGDFTFVSETGELLQQEGAGPETSVRLQPQPAKLLRLLLDKYPAIVSQQEIQEAIWPEVQVDYESSIHFCIRQVRTALNDKAADPRYIETIPRRGYRWMMPFTKEEPPAASPRASNQATRSRPGAYAKVLSVYKFGIIGLALLFLLFSLVFLLTGSGPANRERITRIAIMPFEPTDSTHPFAGNDIALRLVDRLTNQEDAHLDIIGPTTTASFTSVKIQDMTQQLKLDYVLNGRFSQEDEQGRLLAEVIRATDGAHVWVRYYSRQEVLDSMVLQMERGLLGELKVGNVK